MNNFRYKLMNFMRGRNGADAFSRFLSWLAFVLILISLIPVLRFLDFVGLAVLIYSYFRILSRNTAARYKENCWYLTRRERFVSWLWSLKNRSQQARYYHIYKCPGCGQKIRIPRGKGKIMVRCPKCGKEFQKHS